VASLDIGWHKDLQPLKNVLQWRSSGAIAAFWLLPRSLALPASLTDLASFAVAFACALSQGCALKHQPLPVVDLLLRESAVLILIIHVAAQACLT